MSGLFRSLYVDIKLEEISSAIYPVFETNYKIINISTRTQTIAHIPIRMEEKTIENSSFSMTSFIHHTRSLHTITQCAHGVWTVISEMQSDYSSVQDGHSNRSDIIHLTVSSPGLKFNEENDGNVIFCNNIEVNN